MKYLLLLVPFIVMIMTAGCVIFNNNPPASTTPGVVYVTVLVTPTITHYLVDVTPRTKVVAAMAQQIDATHMIVTYQGGQDAGTCIGIQWKVTDPTGNQIDSTLMGVDNSLISTNPLAIGSRATFLATTGRDHVVATAYFSNGYSQIILDTYV